MTAPFPCSRCGSCCRQVRLVPDLAGYDRGDGQCRYLDEKNGCAIYAARPDICDVRKQWELNWKGEYSWEGFCAMNKAACAKLMKGELKE